MIGFMDILEIDPPYIVTLSAALPTVPSGTIWNVSGSTTM